MPNDKRPDPKELLSAIKRREDQEGKGQLKIFLGMSAGVGKTYAMLENAHKLQKKGIDVQIGLVKTHNRPETEALLDGLKIIPEKKVTYKNVEFEEMDLDEILRRRPQLVIVDELPHTNVPGMRHPKRWHDVLEILDNGIDVWTAINVQHIESLKDIVESITEINIRETVPDIIIERANLIELVDITPSDLLQRMKEGKVYLGDKSKVAVENFFREDRLAALRGIVLRVAAEKVYHDLHGMIESIENVKEWKHQEKLMVLIQSNIESQKLIRTTRRLSFNFDAPWIALYVNTGGILAEKEEHILEQNLALARDLGAEVVTINNPDYVNCVEETARQKNVTQIITSRPESGFFSLMKKSLLLEKLVLKESNIDIYVMRDIKAYTPKKIKKRNQLSFETLLPYLYSFFFILFLTLVSGYFSQFIGYKVIGFIFLLGILLQSLIQTRGPLLFSTVLYALIWDYFFIPPFGTFFITEKEDIILIILYLITALITSTLIERDRFHLEILQKREHTILELYEIVREIAGFANARPDLTPISEKLKKILDGSVEFLIKSMDNGINLDNSALLQSTDEKEQSAALWVYEHGKEAGWSTTTLPFSKHYFIPLKGYNEIVGIFIYRPNNENKKLSIEEKNFANTVCHHLANFLERAFEEEKFKKAEQYNQIEKIQQNILKNISTKLEMPIEHIQSAVKELKGETMLTEKVKVKNIEEIETSSFGLAKIILELNKGILIENIIPLEKRENVIFELLMGCADNLKKKNQVNCKVFFAKGIPPVYFDFALMELALYILLFTLIDNSSTTSEIHMKTKLLGKNVLISLNKKDCVLPENIIQSFSRNSAFIMNYVEPNPNLPIEMVQAIILSHKGFIEVKQNQSSCELNIYIPL